MSMVDQWATATPLIQASMRPTWVADEAEQTRIAAYDLYENIYWNVPETFRLLARGEDENPIYIPSGKQIVETLHRYMANGMAVVPDPAFGTSAQQTAAGLSLTSLFRRERFYSKFSSNKRYGIMRGDWMFHITAEPERPEGSRISMLPIHPGNVFPITNPSNVDEVIGYHIVELFMNVDNEPRLRRLTYRKETGTGGPSPIIRSLGVYEVTDWGGPGMDPEVQPESVELAEETLPPLITALPVYHIQNFDEQGSIYGASEMKGIERIIAGINQGISDEELALALEGIGVYATDAGTPVDDEGNDVGWNMGPGRVVELPDGKEMVRLSGVTSVSPYQDHLKYLHAQLDSSAAIPGVAKGNVEVAVAESGIALMLQMAPLLSSAGEKELVVTDVVSNMLFDLRSWFLAYEGSEQRNGMDVVQFLPVYAEKLPVNRKQKFGEIIEMFKSGLVSGAWALKELSKIGYEFGDPQTMLEEILTETEARSAVEADAFGQRVSGELEAIVTEE